MPFTACDLTTVRGRLIGLFNAAQSGTWTTSIAAVPAADRDTRRNDTELDKAILAADARVCRTIAGALGHGYRSQFLTDSAEIDHGGLILPTHIGPPEQVFIKAAADGVWRPGKHDEALTVDDIERWRAGGVYGATAHNAEGSLLACYYLALGLHLFFTGTKGKCKVAVFTKTGACQAPVDMEDLVLAEAYITAPKEGDKGRFLPVIQSYAAAGFEEIKSGVMALPPLQLAQEAAR